MIKTQFLLRQKANESGKEHLSFCVTELHTSRATYEAIERNNELSKKQKISETFRNSWMRAKFKFGEHRVEHVQDLKIRMSQFPSCIVM